MEYPQTYLIEFLINVIINKKTADVEALKAVYHCTNILTIRGYDQYPL